MVDSTGSKTLHLLSCRVCLQVLVRAAFYLWLTAVNLVALSTVWARIADVIGSGASKRLFGFLAAGATCGDGAPQIQVSM